VEKPKEIAMRIHRTALWLLAGALSASTVQAEFRHVELSIFGMD
jgi:hypothetical protein